MNTSYETGFQILSARELKNLIESANRFASTVSRFLSIDWGPFGIEILATLLRKGELRKAVLAQPGAGAYLGWVLARATSGEWQRDDGRTLVVHGGGYAIDTFGMAQELAGSEMTDAQVADKLVHWYFTGECVGIFHAQFGDLRESLVRRNGAMMVAYEVSDIGEWRRKIDEWRYNRQPLWRGRALGERISRGLKIVQALDPVDSTFELHQRMFTTSKRQKSR